MTPGVRQFVRVVVPATLGAGVYQISAFIDTFFLTRIGEGAMSYFNYADRLNQLPLGVIGAALGTAILPQVSRFVGAGDATGAARVQGEAAELATLLCLPAALALGVSAGPLVAALFEGGRFSASDAAATAITLAIIVTGLPAYVLVKVLTPGFYARQDTATPVKTAGVVLAANVALNFLLIPPFGIAGLAAAIAICSWLNCVILYVILHRRGHFRVEGWLASRIARQLAAGLVSGLESYKVERVQYGKNAKATDFPISDRVLEAFRNFVRTDTASQLTPAQLDEELEFVKLRLREEIITAAYSNDAGARVLLDSDPQVLRALEALPEAKRLAESARSEELRS